MDTYFLTHRFGDLVVYNLKKLSVDVLNTLGVPQKIGEMQVIIDKHTNQIGHNTADIEWIKEYLETLDPQHIESITDEEIDELMNT